MNRQKAGFASATVAASIAAHVGWLDEQIEAVMDAVRSLGAADPALTRNLVLLRSVEPRGSPDITGFGEVSATILLAELPNIADLTPKALAAFAGLSPSRSDPSPKEPAARRPEGEHSSGSSVRRPSPLGDPSAKQPAAEPPEGKISRAGSQRLRSTLYMCALSAKRTNKALAGFVQRLTAAGKPPKVILVAVARKLLVYAHAVIRTQTPFDPSPDALSPT